TLADVCELSGGTTLSGGSSAGNGLYSGTGVMTDGLTFNADSAGVGTFTLTYTYADGNGCSNSATSSITVNPLPNANAGADQSICLGTSANLSASGGVSYAWDNSVTGATQSVSPIVTTTYVVTVTDVNGCSKD